MTKRFNFNFPFLAVHFGDVLCGTSPVIGTSSDALGRRCIDRRLECLGQQHKIVERGFSKIKIKKKEEGK